MAELISMFGRRKPAEQARPEAAKTMLAMFHKVCGKVVIYVNPELVDNPDKAFMASDVLMPDGSPGKPGKPLVCQCGARVGFGPEWLDFERHANEYKAERIALAISPLAR